MDEKGQLLSPRLAFDRSSGEISIVNKCGEVLKVCSEKAPAKPSNPKVEWTKTITVHYREYNPCELWITIEGEDWCLLLDCETYAFIGLCN